MKNKEFLDNSLIVRLHRLFRIYREIPLTDFLILYKLHYKEVFDPYYWGYNWELAGFFDKLQGMVEIKCYRNCVPVYALKRTVDPLSGQPKSRNAMELIRQRGRRIVMEQLFDPELPIWSEHKDLLKRQRSDIHIDLSPLEIVLLKDEDLARKHIAKFDQILSEYPNGIEMDQLYGLFGNLKATFELFGTPDVSSLTQEYFELFHVRQTEDSFAPRVFNGRTTTDQDFHIKEGDAPMLAARSILDGLYQKTLLLLSLADGDGMKLGVWRGTIRSNFGNYDSVVRPLTLLKAWRDEGLIFIRTGTYYRNDLIIHFPSSKVSDKYIRATKEQLVELADWRT